MTTHDSHEATEGAKPRLGLLGRIRRGLTRAREAFTDKLVRLTQPGRAVDAAFFDELEELLIEADVGVHTAMEIVDSLREEVRRERDRDTDGVKAHLAKLLAAEFADRPATLNVRDDGLTVIMIVGVNGSGKTTTAGKLALRFREQGKSVILGATDTFRAAAVEQLKIWGERTGATGERPKKPGA